jgi:hypothetical protein
VTPPSGDSRSDIRTVERIVLADWGRGSGAVGRTRFVDEGGGGNDFMAATLGDASWHGVAAGLACA